METNSLVGKVYFESEVSLPTPPEYFLQRIYDFDSMLVMFPSSARPGAYVIARRREHTVGLSGAALAALTNPDTRLCVAMGWIPVCVMVQSGISWDPSQIIAKLKARDLWEHGGADKVADMLEADEAKAEETRKKAIRDEMWDRSGDGWRTYQARTGASSILANDNYPTPVTEATVQQPPPLEAQQDGQVSPATVGGEV
jgi:hypothetical protein